MKRTSLNFNFFSMSLNKQDKFKKEMASAAIGMATVSMLLNPLDVIKVRIQQGRFSQLRMFACANASIQEAGGVLRGLILPGLTATVIRDILNGAFRVGLYKEIERNLFPPNSETPVIIQKISTGCIVGSLGAGAWSHTDLVKTRMQLDNPKTAIYKNTWDCYRCILKVDGIKGLFKGLGPNMVRASIITTCHVGTYDWSKSILTPLMGEGALAWTICGLTSALVTTTASAPVDLIRNHIMASKSRSSLNVFRQLMQSGSILTLYKGWLPSFYRFGPHFTLSWPLIELARTRIFNLEPF
jgi:hypothetical protein